MWRSEWRYNSCIDKEIKFEDLSLLNYWLKYKYATDAIRSNLQYHPVGVLTIQRDPIYPFGYHPSIGSVCEEIVDNLSIEQPYMHMTCESSHAMTGRLPVRSMKQLLGMMQ
jgi:hypothetical protein